MKKKIAFFFLAFLCVGLRAQSLATWTFENISSAVPSTPISASSYSWKVDNAYAYISGGNNTGSPDACSGVETWATNFWPTSSSSSSGDYLEFEAQAKSGYDLIVSEFVFSSNLSSFSGARKFDLYYSVDGSSEVFLGSGSQSFSFCSQHSYSLSAQTSSGGYISFRIYPYEQDPAAMAATLRIDNVSIRGQALLPVSLVEWTGEVREGGIFLSWSTTSEQSNAYFSIERRTDSSDFEEVERLSGRGNSQQKTAYSFLDAFPVSGNNYYRLKQVDDDQTVHYSKTIVLTYRMESHVRIFPSLVRNELNVDLNNLDSPKTLISIHDAYGARVFQRAYTSSLVKQSIEVENWEKGFYLVIIETEKERLVRRFIKQ